MLERVDALARGFVGRVSAKGLVALALGSERVNGRVDISKSWHLPQRLLFHRHFGVLQPTGLCVISARNGFSSFFFGSLALGLFALHGLDPLALIAVLEDLVDGRRGSMWHAKSHVGRKAHLLAVEHGVIVQTIAANLDSALNVVQRSVLIVLLGVGAAVLEGRLVQGYKVAHELVSLLLGLLVLGLVDPVLKG